MKPTLFLLMALAGSVASAGTQTGTVYLAQTSYASSATHPGYAFLYLNGGTKTGTPACATISNGTRWVINNAWPAAKSQLAILLAAFISGKRVTITGSNDCAVWGDSETVIDIQVLD